MTQQSERPFDLAKIDTESIRKARRKKLILYSLPVVLVVAIIAIKLVILTIATSLAQQAYDQRQYSAAGDRLTILSVANVIESYRYHYNKGTSLLKATQYTDAEKELRIALDTVPLSDECFVRVNLVLAIIAQADKNLQDKKYEEAIIGYDNAKSVVEARDCGLKLDEKSASKQTKEADEKLQKKKDEVGDKQKEAKKAQNGDKNDESDDASDDQSEQSDDEPSESQQQELEKQQAENDQKTRQDRNAQRGRDTDKDSYNDRSYKDKRW